MAQKVIYEGSPTQLYRNDLKAFRLNDFMGRLLSGESRAEPLIQNNTACDIFHYKDTTLLVTYSGQGNTIKASGEEKHISALSGLVKKIKEAEIHY